MAEPGSGFNPDAQPRRKTMEERFAERSKEQEQRERAPEVVDVQDEVTEQIESQLPTDAKYMRATELSDGLRTYSKEFKDVMRGGVAATPELQQQIEEYRVEKSLDSNALAAQWLKSEWISEARENVDNLLMQPNLSERDQRALNTMKKELYNQAMGLEGNRHEDAQEAA